VTVVAIENPVTLLEESLLIAAEASVTTALGGAAGGRLVALDVSADSPLLLESGALVAHSAGIALSESDEYAGQVRRRDGKMLAAGAAEAKGLPSIGSGRQQIWVIAEGEGVVLLQNPAD
jgi:hypothetical protein